LISFPIDSKEINTMDVYSNAINTVSMDGLLVGRFEIIAIRIGFIAALSFSFSVSLYFFLVLPFFARHRLLMRKRSLDRLNGFIRRRIMLHIIYEPI
jgi:hypothetical protein